MPATTGFASKVRTSRLETVSTVRPSLQDVALGNSQYRPPIITGRRAWKQSVPSAHHYRTSRLETVSTIRGSGWVKRSIPSAIWTFEASGFSLSLTDMKHFPPSNHYKQS
jgi:hypothetical protein